MRETYVDEGGRLVLPPEIATELGLTPGARTVVDMQDNRLCVRRPPSQLARLDIEVTNRCNLSCTTCMRRTWDEPAGDMDAATFTRLLEGLRAFSPPPRVFFGGLGEPLLHRDIVDMVRQTKALGGQIELITNAILLTPDLSRGLIEAGLDGLWVSLDGATGNGYAAVRRGGTLDAVVANLMSFRRQRRPAINPAPALGIAFVATRDNVADLPALLNLGRRVGASRYSVSNVLPHSAEMATQTLVGGCLWQRSARPTPYTPRTEVAKMHLDAVTQPALWDLLRREADVVYAGVSFGNGENRCPFIERGSAAVRWDGELSPCTPLLHTHVTFLDDRQRVARSWTLGNVNQTDLAALWHRPEHQAFRRRVQVFDFAPCIHCGGCEMAEANEEDCFGNAFPTCGGCLWAQGVIRCP